MDRVVKECTRHLIKNLNVENCIETRSLPGIARNKAFVEQVDTFIAKEVCDFRHYRKAATLDCVAVEASVQYYLQSYGTGGRTKITT
jgi:influenza virus NS1A-binding protein